MVANHEEEVANHDEDEEEVANHDEDEDDDDEKEEIELFRHAFKIGLPEVDKLIEGHPFDYLVVESRKVVPLLKDNNNNDDKDRISELPDYILQFIISFLTMREGAATCILSRSWKNLWSTSASCLDFTDSIVFGYEDPKNIRKLKKKQFLKTQRGYRRPQMNWGLHFQFRRKGFMDSQRRSFIRRVNQILELRRASTMNKFRVSFPLVQGSASHVDRWMKLAAAQGVSKLKLNFNLRDLGTSFDSGIFYRFPVRQFGSSLIHMRLRFCTIDFPHDFHGLNSLLTLSLTDCILTDNDVQSILSNCPSLEFLSLRLCHVYKPTTLKLVGPSISLKHLDIGRCTGINEIELRDVNLLSFELRGAKTKLSIKNAPHLARLVLQMIRCGSFETLSNVPRLETLFLDHQDSKLPKLSAFNNLKQLVLSANFDKSNLFEALCFLEGCPLLEQLHVDMGISSERHPELTEQSTKITTRPGCPHNNLKEVEVYEFGSHSEQIEFAKYLLKNAMVLEKMKIYTTRKTYHAHGIWTLSKRTTKPLRKSLDQVRELLLKEKCASTELLFV